MTTPRRRPDLLIASNRLPVSLERVEDDQDRSHYEARQSAGGLATALRGVQEESPELLWVGWPGGDVSQSAHEEVSQQLRERALVPVFLSPRERSRYYNGFCNGVLWPFFHYFTDRVHFETRTFSAYEDINARFAEILAREAAPGAHVWVHDFQLMRVPLLLRRLRPDLEISFFLHIPFPSSEIYRSLPVREEILLGLLGADYIGFHTTDYVRHFRSSCLRVLGVESDPTGVSIDGRRVGLGAHPIGIPVARFQDAVRSETARSYHDELSMRYAERRVLLGVERLDYTKGITHKLDAYEEFLLRDPARARTHVLVQLIVPSRLDNAEYRQLKRSIEEQIGRINGRFAAPGLTPIEYLHRDLDIERLAALYAFVDAMLVMPVRDGMNLVAQEFVACQATSLREFGHPPGALLLSEFAGAAHSLSRAILVNPWDAKRTASAIEEALSMPESDRTARIEGMAAHVEEMDGAAWAREFLATARRFIAEQTRHGTARRLDDAARAQMTKEYATAPLVHLFLDYDGTLRELTRLPREARPTDELRTLLSDLAAHAQVHIVSGRDRRELNAWLGDLPVYLAAEHGYAARAPGGEFEALVDVDLSFMPRVIEILERVVREVPGSLLEKKACSVAWHYRMADVDYGSWRARELTTSFEDELANQPAEVLLGHKVVEVRAAGVHKGGYVRRALANIDVDDAFVLCIGDDRTDLDMFAALPPSATKILLGSHGESEAYSLDNPAAVRKLLRTLADARAQACAPAASSPRGAAKP